MGKRKSVRTGARLGQHFLTGTWAATILAKATGMTASDTVLEIGPGKGALTKEILKTGARVVAIEKDAALVEKLTETFRKEVASGHLQLHSGDVRDFSPEKSGLRAEKYILAANIPYYITGEIIRQFLSSDTQPYTMALLVQKEVAQRILGARRLPAGRQGKESILSISVKVYGQPKIVAKVSRGNFSPSPSVDSAILLVSNISKSFFTDLDEKLFFTVVRAGFSSKRKKLSSNLSVWGKEKVARIFESLGLSENVRAEDVSVEQWKYIAKNLI